MLLIIFSSNSFAWKAFVEKAFCFKFKFSVAAIQQSELSFMIINERQCMLACMRLRKFSCKSFDG